MFKEKDNLYLLCPSTLDERGGVMPPEKVVENIVMPRYSTVLVYKILNTTIHKVKYNQALADIVSSLHKNDFLVEMIDRDDYLIKVHKGDNDENFVVAHVRIVEVMETAPRLVV